MLYSGKCKDATEELKWKSIYITNKSRMRPTALPVVTEYIILLFIITYIS